MISTVAGMVAQERVRGARRGDARAQLRLGVGRPLAEPHPVPAVGGRPGRARSRPTRRRPPCPRSSGTADRGRSSADRSRRRCGSPRRPRARAAGRTGCRGRTPPHVAATRGPRDPGTVRRNVMAPAWATTTSRFEGSVMTARSAGRAGADGSERALAAVLLGRDQHDEDLAVEGVEAGRRDQRPDGGEDRRHAALHVARAASDRPAVADLGAPRVDGPRAGIAGRDDVEMPGQDDPPPARTAAPPEHDRQRRPRHLLAGPVRVVPDRRPDPGARPRPPGPAPPAHRRPRRPRPPRIPSRSGPDERLQVGQQPVAVHVRDHVGECRRATGGRRPVRHRWHRQPRRMGRVMHVGPPEPLTPT